MAAWYFYRAGFMLGEWDEGDAKGGSFAAHPSKLPPRVEADQRLAPAPGACGEAMA